jgi:hypothetical protein
MVAMNAFNPLEATKRLQAAGIARRQAEAIASEIGDGMSHLVTKENLRDQLEAALAGQTIRNGIVTSGIVAIATTVLGLLISLQ